MRIVIIGVIVAALAVAGVTAGLIQQYLSEQKSDDSEIAETKTVGVVKILVAARDVPAGAVIKENQFVWRDWPEKGAKANYFVEGEDVLDELMGKAMRRGVGTGEPLTRSRVFTPGEGSHMAGILRPGMRAISIKVDAVSGVSGFVSPGDKVDLFLYHTKEISKGGGNRRDRRRYAEPILIDVPVLGVDQTVDDMEGNATLSKTVTLEVTPKQAEVVAVAREMGIITLALHSLAQPEKSLYVGNFTTDTELSRALGGAGAYRKASAVVKKVATKKKSVIRAKRPARRRFTVDIYRATEKETLVFSGKVP